MGHPLSLPLSAAQRQDGGDHGSGDVSVQTRIIGSVTATRSGVNLFSVHLPLNADVYADIAMGIVNTSVLPLRVFKASRWRAGTATRPLSSMFSVVSPRNMALTRYSGRAGHRLYSSRESKSNHQSWLIRFDPFLPTPIHSMTRR